MKIEQRKVSALIPYIGNARTHSDGQIAQIMASIKEFGFTNPVLVDAQDGIIAGHGRVIAAQRLELANVPVIVLGYLTETQRRAYVIADNQIALNAGWNAAMLKDELEMLKLGGFELDLLGFDPVTLEELLAPPLSAGLTDEDEIPAAPVKPISRRGDIWVLDRHRVMCGDSIHAESVSRLTAGAADCILTDPPYCSGGFQEAGKAAGSIGTRQNAKISNDRLSTRGYLALMDAVLQVVAAPVLYAFTDWRMWTNLFDVAERNGYGARSMIVWDKGTPGMGRGWRSQHEIILLGAQAAIPFSPKKSQGNVIACKRQANELHPTQKPVELLRTIIDTTDFASTFYDPFGGSGSTVIACELMGKQARVMELSPAFVDVTVRRWQDFIGKQATLEATGETFNEVSAQRLAATEAA